ncbi:MAG: mitomycin resistance protein [Gammaproteobacteria bacterium]|nr:MAG: mitomycin resistance protein [Gammaproteobacteria bacterium]
MKHLDKETVSRLEDLPNIGPAIANQLRLIGIDYPKQLIGKDPLQLYDQLCMLSEVQQDPCIVDTFMAVVHFMESGEVLPWWVFTDQRKAIIKTKKKKHYCQQS